MSGWLRGSGWDADVPEPATAEDGADEAEGESAVGANASTAAASGRTSDASAGTAQALEMPTRQASTAASVSRARDPGRPDARRAGGPVRHRGRQGATEFTPPMPATTHDSRRACATRPANHAQGGPQRPRQDGESEEDDPLADDESLRDVGVPPASDHAGETLGHARRTGRAR